MLQYKNIKIFYICKENNNKLDTLIEIATPPFEQLYVVGNILDSSGQGNGSDTNAPATSTIQIQKILI